MNLASPAQLVLLILTAGLASQWLAWRLRLPGIVMLIGAGLLLGPVFGVLQLKTPSEHLTELIGLGVAIILFEGGLDLKLGELKKAGHSVGRLVLLGVPITWLPTAESASTEERRLSPDQRGHLAFVEQANYDWLHQRLDEGWRIRRLRLDSTLDAAALTERFGWKCRVRRLSPTQSSAAGTAARAAATSRA